ncbi:lipoprotein lipase [Astyanax mexicanus]|uniref:triacylglycerol lipase n=2 Tax=Astyanax mexicanus TaxID=7994 RepID=A0A8B9LF54_ASTMX|nr:lipoprotein lipase [Astyanax mexicanus]KAG9266655.1 lipoprotein lipase-like [Astyanax mexicanus]
MRFWPLEILVLVVTGSSVLCESSLEGELPTSLRDNFLEPISWSLFHQREANNVHAKFSLRKPSLPDDDICYIVPGEEETLGNCNFNNTAKTFLVIHGWTVSGLFESWVAKMVAALYGREKDANVIVVDWLNTAQDHYIVAAQNTQKVGQEVGRFIDWMEDKANIPLEKLHLIGYSLGAHVAGFAGSHATNKVGRITGLDPAGPDFEGVHAHERLSPDDAHFVDVLHTFSRGSLGLSIGIEQPIGHVDIYPNGGSFQPGCNLRGALEKLANLGLIAMNEAIKCEHERSVHLFIDSLLNGEEPSKAYTCGSSDMFERGMCLSCRKNRCSIMGYDMKKVRKARSVKMFTKTRASMPFRVHHYQLKIHFTGQKKQTEIDPTVMASLYGTNGSVENLHLKVDGKITPNKTHSFLLVTEEDIGDLLMLKLRVEDSSNWSASSLFGMVQSWWNGESSDSEPQIQRIRIRIGETQKKMVFCLKFYQKANLSHEATFVKCKESWRKSSKRTRGRSIEDTEVPIYR